MRRILALGLLLLPLLATAAPRPAAFVAGQLEDGVAALTPVNARRGQRITLYAVLRIGNLYYSDAPALAIRGAPADSLRWGGRPSRPSQIGGRRLPAARLRPFSQLADRPEFRWFQVEPEPHHVRLNPPNPGNPAYSNAVLFGKSHGRWLGYDRIEYASSPIVDERAPSLKLRRVSPSNAKVNVHDGLGTMRYRVLISAGERSYSSPGIEAVGPHGMLPTVMRVSFRESDDLVGWMTAYFNVPNVFGSGGDGKTHQTELFQGADCADVITGGARLAGARMAYTSVMGLRRYARPVSPVLLLEQKGVFAVEPDGSRGQPVELRFGRDVRRGDLMLIDYVGFDDSPRTWDHIAVIARDRGRQGVFDPRDTVLHMGYLYGLVEAEAHTEGPARIQLLRFRPELLRRLAPALAGR